MRRLIDKAVCFILGRRSIKRKNGKRFKSFGVGSFISYPYIINACDSISIGSNTKILHHSRIQSFGQKNDKLQVKIGNCCYICSYFSLLNASTITIGDNVLIASHVMITSENHCMDPESELPYMDQPLDTKPIEIGNGCWIGEKVCILPGVKIGEKAIIGAGSVVTKSIPNYSIAVGNPAKVIKRYDFKTHSWVKV